MALLIEGCFVHQGGDGVCSIAVIQQSSFIGFQLPDDNIVVQIGMNQKMSRSIAARLGDAICIR